VTTDTQWPYFDVSIKLMQQPEFFRDFARALASFKDPILRRLFYEYILHNPEVLGECVIPLYVTRAEDCIAV
jgi:hypothetical protein